MRSIQAKDGTAQARRAWEAPAITELPIGSETRAADITKVSLETGPPANPPPPATPSTKLGFSFEMAFPLSARTE